LRTAVASWISNLVAYIDPVPLIFVVVADVPTFIVPDDVE
jgi:hypothetical protein